MRIIETYSHLNGLEFLLVHKRKLWAEIKKVITEVDGSSCKTKVSKESRKVGNLLYSPIAMNSCFRTLLKGKGWHESRVSYWVTKDAKLIRRTLTMPPDEQKKEILEAGAEAIFSYNQ